MRTTVDLPEPLLRNARRRATQRGVTLSAVVEDALRGHLAQRQAPHPRSFRLLTVGGRLMQPDLDLDRTSAVLAEDDAREFSARRRA